MRKQDKLGVDLDVIMRENRNHSRSHHSRFQCLNMMYWSRYRMRVLRHLLSNIDSYAKVQRHWDKEDWRYNYKRLKQLMPPKLP